MPFPAIDFRESGSGRSRPLLERFEEKYVPTSDCGCWLWLGSIAKAKGASSDNCYGIITLGGGVRVGAHVAAWMLFRGPVPDGLEVCHTCDLRLCVNPSHLFVGTRADNMRDCISKGRAAFQVRPESQLRGSDASNVILSEQQIAEAKALRSSGWLFAKLAERYGVHRTTIAKAVNGTNWAHLSIDLVS